jgi:SH3-like domain-containing protein
MFAALRCLPRLLPIVAIVALTSLASEAVAQRMVSVKTNEANLRSGPGTQHDVQWVVDRGFPLEVLSRRGSWLQVRDFENDRAWIHRSLTGTTPHFIVTAKVANVRSEPTTSSRILGKLAYGDLVKTLARKTGWIKIQRAGMRGWVSKKLLWGW